MARALVPDEVWSPMPYVLKGVFCHMCFRPIPRSRPREHEKSERTRAFYSYAGKVWECLECHAYRVEAALAGSAIVVVWAPAPADVYRRGRAEARPPMPDTVASVEKPSVKRSETVELPLEMTG